MTVAGSVDIALGDAGFESADLNDWVSGPLFVGGDFLAAGGPGADEIGLFGDTEINGALIADLGDWVNQLFLGFEGGGVTTIGGDLGYTGGVGLPFPHGPPPTPVESLVGGSLSIRLFTPARSVIFFVTFQEPERSK